MAFNPFHVFRKHQKVVMAGMVFVAMITFILFGGMAGGGDFFGWLNRMIASRGSDREAFTVFGKKVTAPELQYLQQQREIANMYMIMATEAAIRNRQLEILKSVDAMKLPQEEKGNHFRSILQRDPTLAELLDQVQASPMERFMMSFRMSQGASQILDRRASYFGESMESDTERPDRLNSLIDFLIWKHEADRLGIQLTEAEVNAEVQRLTRNRLSPAASQDINKTIRGSYKSVTPAVLVSALTDEFRVRLARAALEGYEPASRSQVPAPVTPNEFWKFYKDNRTEIQVALLSIPVRGASLPETAAGLVGLAGQALTGQPAAATTAAVAGTARDFTAAVKEKPTEAELQALFKKYRADEPKPESETPGFKQPRRIQVQWVSAKSNAPEFKKAADVVLAVTRVTLPLGYDIGMLNDYEDQKWKFRAARWTDPNFALPYYRGLNKSENVAATVGQAPGALSTQAPPLLAAMGYQAGVVAREQQEVQPLIDAEIQPPRIPVGCTLLLAGANPVGALSAAAPLSYAAKEDQYLPLELIQKELLQRVQDGTAQELAASKLQNFLTREVEERLKKPDARKDPNLPKELAATAQRDGLQTGMMAAPRSQYDIARDPSLKPLKNEITGAGPQNRQADRNFAEVLFGRGSAATRVFDVERLPMGMQAKRPLDDSQWRTAKEPILYWKVKDEPASIPPSLDKVRDQVVAAWKLQKARGLAQKEAERVAAAVAATKGNIRQLRDLAARENLPMFELGPIAKLLPRREAIPQPNTPPSYESFRLPEDRIVFDPRDAKADFEKKFVEQLLSLKDKPLGTTQIVTDQPKETYYVAVLIGSYPPSEGSFYLTYRQDSSAPPPRPDAMFAGNRETLLARFEQEQRQKYRKDFMEQLRVQAGINDNNPGKEFRRGYDNRGGPLEE